MSKLIAVSFKIEKELLDEVDEIAKAMEMSRSAVIRRALRKYVKKWKKEDWFVSERIKIL